MTAEGLEVMVVDDEPDVLNTYSDFLCGRNYQTVRATSSYDAIDHLARRDMFRPKASRYLSL